MKKRMVLAMCAAICAIVMCVAISASAAGPGMEVTTGVMTVDVNDPVSGAAAVSQNSEEYAGNPNTFTASAAAGTTPYNYQWWHGTIAIPGATMSAYTIASVTTADSGSYTCVVGNMVNNATSNAVTLTVYDLLTTTMMVSVDSGPPTPAPNTVSVNPTLPDAGHGGLAPNTKMVFTVTPSGGWVPHTYTYQWDTSADSGTTWTSISGETVFTLTVTPIAEANQLQYRCRVRDDGQQPTPLLPGEGEGEGEGE